MKDVQREKPRQQSQELRKTIDCRTIPREQKWALIKEPSLMLESGELTTYVWISELPRISDCFVLPNISLVKWNVLILSLYFVDVVDR